MANKICRVVALTTSYPLRESGWAGVFIQKLYENLCSEVAVVCPADDQPARVPMSGKLSVHPVSYAPMRFRKLAQQSGGVAPGLRKYPWRALLLPLLVGALIQRTFAKAREADVIHANWAVCGAVAVFVGILRRRPVVTTLRGDDVKRAAHSLVDRWLLKIAVSGSRRAVCVSDAMARDLRAFLPKHADKVAVIRNGVDEAFLSVERSTRVPGVLRLGGVGSLIPRKGFDILLSAISLMKHRDEVLLAVIGDGPERERLERQARDLNIADHVRFLGEIPPKDMPRFFATIDLFVLSSRSEGRPNVVIEALAAGLPVISTDLPGVRDLVIHGDTGWLVRQEDARALANTLDEACSDPSRGFVMGAAARKRMRRDGGWSRTAVEYQSIFDQVVDAYRGVV